MKDPDIHGILYLCYIQNLITHRPPESIDRHVDQDITISRNRHMVRQTIPCDSRFVIAPLASPCLAPPDATSHMISDIVEVGLVRCKTAIDTTPQCIKGTVDMTQALPS
ncbi:hypothetical protein BGX30_001798 [Mortierella sp. GBA39]|nr:hypothetical protein BGX30_001798 [Mortierella sp. GBA39]